MSVFELTLVFICCLSWQEIAAYQPIDADRYTKLPVPTRECSPEFKQKFFDDGMSKFRWVHNVPHLKYKDHLMDAAQAHANSLLNDFQEHYIPNYEYGQIIYTKSVDDPNRQVNEIQFNLKDAVHYEQEPKYCFYGGEPPEENYHTEQWAQFVQLVWKETKWMGLGCSSGYEERTQRAVIFLVVFFEPKGLVPGRFGYNVHPYMGGVDLEIPMQTCPDDYQQIFLRRMNEDMYMYYHGSGFVLNHTIAHVAQTEANRLRDIGELLNIGELETVNSYSRLDSDYGTLVHTFANYGSQTHPGVFWPRYPIYQWNWSLPRYIGKDGRTLAFSEQMWTKPMQLGIGCATRMWEDSPTLYLVAKFSIPKLCEFKTRLSEESFPC